MSQSFLEKLQATKERNSGGQNAGGGLYDSGELDSILNCKGGCSTDFNIGNHSSQQPIDPTINHESTGDVIENGPISSNHDLSTNLGPSLDDLEANGEKKVVNNQRTSFKGTAWLSPYVAGFPPLSTQLQLVQCHNIGPSGFSYYFPLSFQHDIIAVRFCGTDHIVDLCAKIVQQKSIQIPGKGSGCLIDCQFMGKLFLK